MRRPNIKEPLEFVSAEIRWKIRGHHGLLVVYDNKGGEWPFQIWYNPKDSGVGLGWMPLRDYEQKININHRIQQYKRRHGSRTGLMKVIAPKLKQAFREMIEANPDDDTFSMEGDGPRARLYQSWADLAEPLGFEARKLPYGIQFVRK